MEVKKYEVRLKEMLDEITRELHSVGIQNPQTPSDWIAIPQELNAEEPDENLSADAIEDWNERNALVSTLEPRYNTIVSALEKIKEGTFGTCEICGAEIEERRLDADPASRTCIAHRGEPMR